MRTRYVFPVWAGTPGLGAYSILEARIGSLRLIVPVSSYHTLHLLAILGAAFGYLGVLLLIVSSSFYRTAAPLQNEWFNIAISLVIVVGLFLVLFWEERSVFHWTLRLSSRHPRRFEHLRPTAIRLGFVFQELFAILDDQEIMLRIEGSARDVKNALALARIQVSPKESRRDILSLQKT